MDAEQKRRPREFEAIDFLRALNTAAFAIDPNVMMVAEESTAWPLVTYPVSDGGLGFNLKWNMGWMNDMCHYLKLDPWFRQFHHKDLTFSLMYAFSENFVLPISHDEVVYMKGSLRGKMPGDEWRQLAGVRSFMVYMLTHPGKKLTFMGAELGQWHEWDFAGQLDWYLLENDANRRMQDFFRAVNRYYLTNPALWRIDFDWAGFEWLVADDNEDNTVVLSAATARARSCWSRSTSRPTATGTTASASHSGKRGARSLPRMIPRSAARASGATKACPNAGDPPHGREQSITITIPRSARSSCAARANIRNRKRKKARQGRNYRHEKECIAMLLAGGQGSRLYVLTENMAKPAVPFGGKFRIIDFPLPTARTPASTPSACSRSTARWSSTATSATASPDLDRSDGGVHILPPYQSAKGATWFKGTANAIYQNIGFVDMYDPDYVLILRRPHLQDGLRRHARAPQACARRLHHRRDGGALGRGEPLRHHERRRRGHHHGV